MGAKGDHLERDRPIVKDDTAHEAVNEVTPLMKPSSASLDLSLWQTCSGAASPPTSISPESAAVAKFWL